MNPKIMFCWVFSIVGILSANGQTLIDTLQSKALNNQKPEKWDIKLFDQDKELLKDSNYKPVTWSSFPVEKYNYSVFTKRYNFQLEGKNFSGISFGENVGGKKGKMDGKEFRFDINLIFCTDDLKPTIEGEVFSRNAPYLTVQGGIFIKDKYDFIGVKSPDDTGYLIVNIKSFDLRFGSTIVIFPNDDNSFYYLQLDETPKNSDDIPSFIDRVKGKPAVLQMIKN